MPTNALLFPWSIKSSISFELHYKLPAFGSCRHIRHGEQLVGTLHLGKTNRTFDSHRAKPAKNPTHANGGGSWIALLSLVVDSPGRVQAGKSARFRLPCELPLHSLPEGWRQTLLPCSRRRAGLASSLKSFSKGALDNM